MALRAGPWARELEPEEVRERLVWARRQGRPDYFWPEVPVAAWREGVRELERVATEVLSGRASSLEARDPAGARALGVAGYTSGMGALLGHWLEAGRVRGGESVGRLFALHLAHGRERAERLRQELGRAAEALMAVGIEPLVVKSSHTAVEYFPEPGARPALDVDLVVGARDFGVAEEVLAARGYGFGVRERRPRKSTWVAPGSPRLPRSLELLHADSQYVVDLHESLERNFFGVRTLGPVSPAAVSTRAAPELGAPVRVLRQPALLLYQALHASEGVYNLTLVRTVELVLMIRRDSGSGALDWEEVGALLESQDAGRFVYPAFAMAERLAPGTIEPRVLRLATAAATPRMRVVVAGLTPGGAQRLDVLSLRERFMWCATPGDHLRRLAHMLVPAPAGRSVRRLTAKYVERLYRLVRGRVTRADEGGRRASS